MLLFSPPSLETVMRATSRLLPRIGLTRRDKALVFGVILLLCAQTSRAEQRTRHPRGTPKALTQLSMDELASVEVTTVSKRPEPRRQAPAAIFVITQEDIRRSGATSIPDALRLAPGVQVARINSNQWAIGVRGFASRLARSVLVLIDGRSVYSPLFAGTYWEVQDTLIEDIERIEVIRGPGGTLWGANAVNGVINIITKRARDTQGALATAGAGNLEHGFAGFRYGGSRGTNFNYRVYSKFFQRGAQFHNDGREFDDWRMGQAGFRGDWETGSRDNFTLAGDLYNGRAGQRSTITRLTPPFRTPVEQDSVLSGGNILGGWRRALGRGSELRFRFYYDRTNRIDPTFGENRDTFDFDFQHLFHISEGNLLTWGSAYRVSSGRTAGIPTVAFIPADRTDHLASAFVQDEITIVPGQLRLAVGSKFEHNGYSGFEVQPTGLILWTPTARQTLWASAARAVRTPSRVEQDLLITGVISEGGASGPVFTRVIGSRQFHSEVLDAYQAGYRVQPSGRIWLDAAAFWNKHRDLLSLEPGPIFREDTPPRQRTIFPLSLLNGIHGKSYGAELDSEWSLFRWWRMGATYSYLRILLEEDPGSQDTTTVRSLEGSSPRHQWGVKSFVNLPGNFELDWVLRHVGSLPSQNVRRYTTSDARLAWRPTSRVELSAVGQNLHRPHQAEFSGSAGIQAKRGFYGKIALVQ